MTDKFPGFHTPRPNLIRTEHPSIQMIKDLRTRAGIRRKAKGRKSVEEGQPDRLADQLEAAADMLEKATDSSIEGWTAAEMHEDRAEKAETQSEKYRAISLALSRDKMKVISAYEDERSERALDIKALREVTDPDPCSFDHNGNCQAHGISNPCETAIARERIAKWDKLTE